MAAGDDGSGHAKRIPKLQALGASEALTNSCRGGRAVMGFTARQLSLRARFESYCGSIAVELEDAIISTLTIGKFLWPTARTRAIIVVSVTSRPRGSTRCLSGLVRLASA